MTYYICQCPHLMPATIWTASSEQEIIAAIAGDTDNHFDTAIEAALYDMRDAYVTGDVFDLWLWISGAEAPQATGAHGAFLRDRGIRRDVEAVATTIIDEINDSESAVAFNGRFIWSRDDEEWRLGNREPVVARDLVEALLAASIEVAFLDQTEQQDV